MAEDTFTMADVEAIQLEPEAKPEQQTEEVTEASEPVEEQTSFLETFKKAKDGEDTTKPAEPEPEAKAEEEPADDKKESRSASDFKMLKEERDNAKRELEKMQDQLSELKNSDVDDLMKQLEAERDDLSERLKISSIERHPEFQKRFDNKIAQVIANAQSTVGEHNAERIEKLLRMEESEMRTDGIEAIFAELSPARQAKLGAMLAQVDDVKSERMAMLADADESYKQLAAGQDAQREAHIEASNKVFDNVLEEARNLEVYQLREGEEDWNSEVSERAEQARNVFTGGSSAEQLARASLWASAGPKYRELLRMQVELNRRLQTQITDETGANPTVSSPEGEGGKVEPKSFMEMFGESSGMDMNA